MSRSRITGAVVGVLALVTTLLVVVALRPTTTDPLPVAPFEVGAVAASGNTVWRWVGPTDCNADADVLPLERSVDGGASVAGAVRVRPTGLVAAPAMKRYQYQRSGSRPSTSTCTECAQAGKASAVPAATMRRMASSAATSQRTGTSVVPSPPSYCSRSPISRVHSVTPRGQG